MQKQEIEHFKSKSKNKGVYIIGLVLLLIVAAVIVFFIVKAGGATTPPAAPPVNVVRFGGR